MEQKIIRRQKKSIIKRAARNTNHFPLNINLNMLRACLFLGARKQSIQSA